MIIAMLHLVWSRIISFSHEGQRGSIAKTRYFCRDSRNINRVRRGIRDWSGTPFGWGMRPPAGGAPVAPRIIEASELG